MSPRTQGSGLFVVRAVTTVFVFLAVLAPNAHAAFPGQAGRIAYVETIGSFRLMTVYENGGGVTFPGPGEVYPVEPEWSADGQRIAYVDGAAGNDVAGDILVVNEDGSDFARLTTGALNANPTWSPDGTRIAFERYNEAVSRYELHVMNSDGTNPVQIGMGRDPAWSPDGTKIVYATNPTGFPGMGSEIRTMSPDGSGDALVIGAPAPAEAWVADPEWAPDGNRIVFTNTGFVGDPFDFPFREVHVVDADGTDHQRLTTEKSDFGNPAWSPDGYFILMDASSHVWKMRTDGSFQQRMFSGREPDWQPVPGTTGFARPKGASPDDVPLVPAYDSCIDPNRTHGPPMEEGSCAPPSPASSHLTVGTADSNGRPTKSSARAKLGVLTGNPGTPADEADVSIAVDITDVRREGDLSDYTGELRTERSLRLIDKDGGTAATMVETQYSFTVPCAATADTTIGGHCALATSVDALVPGTIVERNRAIWELGALRVLDGGADEDAESTGDNTLFLTQGLFVP